MEIDKRSEQAADSVGLESSQKNNTTPAGELHALVRQNQLLQEEVARLKQQLRDTDEGGSTYQTLQLAELIIDNSPAILFRRLAAEDPKQRKMVYVSPNISRFGYRAEDFIS